MPYKDSHTRCIADNGISTSQAHPGSNQNQRICRTCLRTIDMSKAPFFHINSTTSPDPKSSATIRQKFATCIPEVALEITSDAIICGFCATSLHWAYEFRTNCMRTEEVICDYIKEASGFIYGVELDKVLTWSNDKNVKKLECVDILGDSVQDVNSIKDDVEIKEEPLGDDTQVVNSRVTASNFQKNIKYEEIQIKEEPQFVDVGKLTEDASATENEVIIDVKEESASNSSTNANESPHVCDKCQASFKLKCDYRLHKILHIEGAKLQCDECEFVAPNQNILRRHLLVRHTKELKFRCKLCGLKIDDVDSHNMQTCKRENVNAAKKAKLQDSSSRDVKLKAQCDRCDYQCDSETTLIGHRIIHDNDMPYVCNICRQAFKGTVDLIQHLSVHSQSGEINVGDYELNLE